MGDMGTHCEGATRDHKSRAYAKFGHLTKEEIIEHGERLRLRIDEKRAAIRALQRELEPLETDESYLTAVFIDDLNGRRRPITSKPEPTP